MYVRTQYQTAMYVIDPGLCLGPVTLTAWLDKQDGETSHKIVPGSVYKYLNGIPFEDNNYEHTLAINEDYAYKKGCIPQD